MRSRTPGVQSRYLILQNEWWSRLLNENDTRTLECGRINVLERTKGLLTRICIEYNEFLTGDSWPSPLNDAKWHYGEFGTRSRKMLA